MDSTEYKVLKGSKCVSILIIILFQIASKNEKQLQMEWRFDYYEYFRKATPFVPYRSCSKDGLMNTDGWSLFLSSVSCRDIESTSVYFICALLWNSYLNLDGDYCDIMKDYIVTFQIVVLNMLEPKLSICKTHRHYVFNSSQSTWGFKYMFRKSEILEKNFIYNGILTVICTINFEDINKLDVGTRFLLSSKMGDEDSVIDLLNNNNNVSVNVKSPLFIYPYHTLFPGATPLIIASNYNQIKIVDLLLHNKDCNINEVNYDNETALHRSCWNGNKEIVMALLNMDANINMKTKLGNTPLMLACKTEMKEIVEILLNHTVKPDLTIQNEDGDTALHIASYSNNADIVKLLIDAGADITVSNERGLKPIDVTKSEDIYPSFELDPNASFSPSSLYILSVIIEAIIPLQEGDPIFIPDVKVYPFNYLNPAEVLMLMFRLSQNALDGKAVLPNLLQESAYYAIFKTYGLWIENEINEDSNSNCVNSVNKKSKHLNRNSSDLTDDDDDDDLSSSSTNVNTYYRNLLLDTLSSILGDNIKRCISMNHTTINVWNTMIDILVSCCIKDSFWEKREIFLDPNSSLTEYKLQKSGKVIFHNSKIKSSESAKVLNHFYYKSIPPCVDKMIISGIRDKLRQICCKNPQHPEKRPYISNSFISKHIIYTERNPVYNIWNEIKPNEIQSSKFPEKFPYEDVYEYFVTLSEGEQEMSWIVTNKNLLGRGYQDHFWSVHRQVLFGNENDIFTARIDYNPSTLSFYVKKEYRNIDTFKIMSEIGERYRNNICPDVTPTFMFRKIIKDNPKYPVIVSDEWVINRFILECYILRIIGERIYEGYNKRQLQYLADEMAVLLVQEEEEEAKRKAKNKKNNKRKSKKGKKKGKNSNSNNNYNNNNNNNERQQQKQQQNEPPPPLSTSSKITTSKTANTATKQYSKEKDNVSIKDELNNSLSDYEASLLTSPFDIKSFDKVIDAMRLIRSSQKSMPASFLEYSIEDLISSDDLADITPEKLLKDLRVDDKNSEEEDDDVKYEFDDEEEREEGELEVDNEYNDENDEELYGEEGEIILESDKDDDDDDDDKRIEDGEIKLIIDRIETIPISSVKSKEKGESKENERIEKERIEKEKTEKERVEKVKNEEYKETEVNDIPIIKHSEKLINSIEKTKSETGNEKKTESLNIPPQSSTPSTASQQTPNTSYQSKKKRKNKKNKNNDTSKQQKQKETQEELKKEIDKLNEKLKEKEKNDSWKDDEIQLKIIEPLSPLGGELKEVEENREDNNIKLCLTSSINSLIVDDKEEEEEKVTEKEEKKEKEVVKVVERNKPKLSIVSSEPIYLEKKEIQKEVETIVPSVSTPPLPPTPTHTLSQQNNNKLNSSAVSSPSLNQFRPVDINTIFGKSNKIDNKDVGEMEIKVIEVNSDLENKKNDELKEEEEPVQPVYTLDEIEQIHRQTHQQQIQNEPIPPIPQMQIPQVQQQYPFEQVVPDDSIQFHSFNQYPLPPTTDIPDSVLPYYYPNMPLTAEMSNMIYQTSISPLPPPLPPPLPSQQPTQPQQLSEQQFHLPYSTDNMHNQQYLYENNYFDYNSYSQQIIPKQEVIETSPLQYVDSNSPILFQTIDNNNVDYSKPYSLFEGNTAFERLPTNELPLCERCGMNYFKRLFIPCKHLYCLRCKVTQDNDKICPICGVNGYDIEISKSF